MSNAELANAYAALILADDGVEITVRALRDFLIKNQLTFARPTNSPPSSKPQASRKSSPSGLLCSQRFEDYDADIHPLY
jgi:hypothetical protein